MPRKTTHVKEPNPPVDSRTSDVLSLFHAPVRDWFEAVFPSPTRPQQLGWPSISKGESTLILAPTGTGKTLAAFLWCLDRMMFEAVPEPAKRCRVLYISPIKALAVDVERNLQSPLVGITGMARKAGMEIHEPTVAIRTGDTSAADRARFARRPSDILITTPESFYLLLTSNAREALRSIETVVLDEIHALVPTKRGSHLALSMERLEWLCGRKLQRIGLSATQRPLEEVARFLGGVESSDVGCAPKHDAAETLAQGILTEFEAPVTTRNYRPVTVVDAGEAKRLDLRVEVPIDDMTRLDQIELLPSGPAAQGPVRPSIWSALHPQLLDLVRKHRSTLIFVNSRRLAERISGAINDLAGETLVRAHHGSVAAPQRKEIEDRLKLGTLRGLVATSSLELGIDMGAIDLVIQIEAPPSIASGIQRVGRANHHVGGTSAAIIFPKYRGDLAACAAITRAMYAGQVESSAYPRNALDVLAQQIVAMVAMDTWDMDQLFSLIRRAAPYASLPRPIFEGVLDMLSGRYPSDEFAELRPRLTWDRTRQRLTTRQGARHVAIANGGTIPDRGLFGVFLAGSTKGSRVGELDEEMVFESRTGDTIILGASTWRIDEITNDRVVVTPAPGEPGKMPFWHGDSIGRPAEFGRRIGEMNRELLALPRPVAVAQLNTEHSLDANAAENLMRYLEDQAAATGRVPSDRDIVIESCRDELGDWRICVLTPFGSRVHAPWCMAAVAKLRAERGIEVESMWTDDGFVIRLPDTESESPEDVAPVDSEILLPSPAELKDLVLRQLGSTSLFASKFREAAARALLLPRRRPGVRAALWQQRKRAADLLAVASRFSTFPILLETYRECVRDVLDIASAAEILRQVQRGEIQVHTVQSEKPSPFAATLLFSYIANYIYEGDAPLAERRAQALSIDQSQLEELLGSTDFRELLDPAVLQEVEAQLQSLDPYYQARHTDGVHDLLLKLGDLSLDEIEARTINRAVASGIEELVATRRALLLRIAGDPRYIAVEHAARYRDAIGTPLPPGLAEVFLERADQPLIEILRRYARTHGPFTTAEVAKRLGLANAQVDAVLKSLHANGKLLEGEFRPQGIHREWCDPDVLQQIRRKTLARLRREVEPAAQKTFARLLCRWQGVTVPRRSADALLDAIEILQGCSLLASDLEREILPARVRDYQSSDLDALISSGLVVWIGREPLGDRDGRIALYLSESLARLLPPAPVPTGETFSPRALAILETLAGRGASFFGALHEAAGGGYRGDTLDALWELAWAGRITNDTLQPIRNKLYSKEAQQRGDVPGSPEFLRRLRAPGGDRNPVEGRWSLISQRIHLAVTPTEWSAAVAQQLLVRHAIVMRETAGAEDIPGGYPTIYPPFKTLEESGRVRRGMFVSGLGAAQFAMPAAVDMLRSLRADPERPEVVHLAASDPANPYGSLLPWPRLTDENSEMPAPHSMARAAGASVILVNGQLAGFLRRRNTSIRVFLPENDPERTHVARELAGKLAEIARRWQSRRGGLLIGAINDEPAQRHFLGRFLEAAGFVDTANGFQMRRMSPAAITASIPDPEDDSDEDLPESA